MAISKEDRKNAAHFYMKRPTGGLQDWIEGFLTDEEAALEVDEDILALAELLSKVRENEK